MRRLFLELFHKQIFPSTPITSFFFIPIVYHCHALNDRFRKRLFMLFLFRFDSDPSVVSLFSRTFSSKQEKIWYTRIVLFKCLLLAKDPTSIIGRSPGSLNKSCFPWFPHVTTFVPIRSIRNGPDKHSIREVSLDSSMWYSFSFGSWNYTQQWLEQLTKSNHFTYFIVPNPFSYLY